MKKIVYVLEKYLAYSHVAFFGVKIFLQSIYYLFHFGMSKLAWPNKGIFNLYNSLNKGSVD
jgi:hypothetical protein